MTKIIQKIYQRKFKAEEYFDQNERTDVYYDVGTRNNNINFPK